MKASLTKLLIPATLVVALFVPLAAQAQTRNCHHPRGVNAREHREEVRIHQGERSGELTRREAERLQAEEARIRVDEAYARRSGGEFTPRERARIERELNRASRDIYRQKHDGQDHN